MSAAVFETGLTLEWRAHGLKFLSQMVAQITNVLSMRMQVILIPLLSLCRAGMEEFRYWTINSSFHSSPRALRNDTNIKPHQC